MYPAIEPFDQGMLDVGDGNRIYWEVCGNPQGKPAGFFYQFLKAWEEAA